MPDLLDKLDEIETQQDESAKLQEKIDRLNELVNKQKKIMAEQEVLINQQKEKLADSFDVPADVYELKELIGTQRALLNEKEAELEHAKSSLVQVEKELELTKNQMVPTQQKLEESFGTMGQLKAELAEKNSELLIKNEKIITLENKVNELQAFSDKLRDEQVKIMSDMDAKHTTQYQSKVDEYLKQIEKLKEEHSAEIIALKEQALQEKADLKGEVTKLETVLLDSKLLSSEASSEAKDLSTKFKEIADKQESLIKQVDELKNDKRLLEADMANQAKVIDSLSTWKHQNINRLTHFEKMTILMEQEPLFKTFLIVDQVGAINLDDLRNATGVPMVQVKKHVQKLQDIDLLKINDVGKIVVVKDVEI